MPKHLYSTCNQSFGFFENEKERKKHKKDISLTIDVATLSGTKPFEKVDLYGFNVIWKGEDLFFAYKQKVDEVGNKICLYYFTEHTSVEYLDKFFSTCRANKIIPLDIVVYIRDALQEKKSLQNARKIMTEKVKRKK